MKLNKILFSALMLSAINGAMTSCSDSFLEEDQITQYDTSYFLSSTYKCNFLGADNKQ